eukprot:scaffold232401_cov21-Tisochrysis_lutea.AAC.1
MACACEGPNQLVWRVLLQELARRALLRALVWRALLQEVAGEVACACEGPNLAGAALKGKEHAQAV